MVNTHPCAFFVLQLGMTVLEASGPLQTNVDEGDVRSNLRVSSEIKWVRVFFVYCIEFSVHLQKTEQFFENKH